MKIKYETKDWATSLIVILALIYGQAVQKLSIHEATSQALLFGVLILLPKVAATHRAVMRVEARLSEAKSEIKV